MEFERHTGEKQPGAAEGLPDGAEAPSGSNAQGAADPRPGAAEGLPEGAEAPSGSGAQGAADPRPGPAAASSEERPRLGGRKAEAAVNDGLILKAAREVLTVAPDTPMAEIAARAGVGVGSLYRRFPSKEALAYRLCLDGMNALTDVARHTLEVIDDDPWEEFVAFIGDSVDAGAGSLRGLAGTFDADEDLNRVAQEMSGLIDEVIRRAQAAGAVRGDINANDIGRFWEMLRAIHIGDADRANALRRRYVALFTPAFRAPAATSLPGPPPSWQEIAAAWNP